MRDARALLERAAGGFDPDGGLEPTLRRAHRRQRRRRLTAASVALALAFAGVAIGVRALGRVQVPADSTPSASPRPSPVRVHVARALADVALTGFVAEDPRARGLVVVGGGFGDSAVLLEFPVVVPGECLGRVTLELYSLEGEGGAGPAVYPAAVPEITSVRGGDRFGHTVLDTRPRGVMLREPTTGWSSFDVTEVYRLWLDEAFTEHGYAIVSENVILSVRPESATYDFRRRFASRERSAALAPRLLVREEPCR
jgi:hypothetical protein